MKVKNMKQRFIKSGCLLVLVFMLIIATYPSTSNAATIVDYDFNNGSWGVIKHGSFWTLQNAGGVGNSKAIRLQYSQAGTANKYAAIDVSSFKSQEFWIELDVKMEGKCSGGSKFIKFFGHNTIHSQNNMTLMMDYGSCKQRSIQYYIDSNCIATYSGVGKCTGTVPVFNYSSSEIDMSGGGWGHYKAHVKRADPGKANGTLRVWWNGVLKADVRNLDSNPSSSATNYIGYIEFGGYNDARSWSGSTWYLWMDNIYVGTTEKNAGSTPSPTPPTPPTPDPTPIDPAPGTDTTPPAVPTGFRVQ